MSRIERYRMVGGKPELEDRDPASEVAINLTALAIMTGRTDVIPADLTRAEMEEAVDRANKLRQRELRLEVSR